MTTSWYVLLGVTLVACLIALAMVLWNIWLRDRLALVRADAAMWERVAGVRITVDAVSWEPPGEEAVRLVLRRLVDIDAHAAYLQARYSGFSGSHEDFVPAEGGAIRVGFAEGPK